MGLIIKGIGYTGVFFHAIILPAGLLGLVGLQQNAIRKVRSGTLFAKREVFDESAEISLAILEEESQDGKKEDEGEGNIPTCMCASAAAYAAAIGVELPGQQCAWLSKGKEKGHIR